MLMDFLWFTSLRKRPLGGYQWVCGRLDQDQGCFMSSRHLATSLGHVFPMAAQTRAKPQRDEEDSNLKSCTSVERHVRHSLLTMKTWKTSFEKQERSWKSTWKQVCLCSIWRETAPLRHTQETLWCVLAAEEQSLASIKKKLNKKVSRSGNMLPQKPWNQIICTQTIWHKKVFISGEYDTLRLFGAVCQWRNAISCIGQMKALELERCFVD